MGFSPIDIGKTIVIKRKYRDYSLKITSDFFDISKIKQRNRYLKTDPVTGIRYL
jgi:hypothetical protein